MRPRGLIDELAEAYARQRAALDLDVVSMLYSASVTLSQTLDPDVVDQINHAAWMLNGVQGTLAAFAEVAPGVGEARNRTRKTVRTVRFALLVHTLIVCCTPGTATTRPTSTPRRAEQPDTPKRPSRPSKTWSSSSAGP
jgi:hypothetical protein